MKISFLLSCVIALSGCSLKRDVIREEAYTCINPEPCFYNPFHGLEPYWDA